MRKPFFKLRYSTKLFLWGSSSLLPWIVITIGNAAVGPLPVYVWVSLIVYSLLASGYSLMRLHALTHEPFNFCSNMVASMRQGDFSMRSRQWDRKDAFGLLCRELNLLAEDLRSNRLVDLEENRRFRLLIDLLEIAVIGVDDSDKVSLANARAGYWMGKPAHELLGVSISDLGLMDALASAGAQDTVHLDLPRLRSRFLIHVARYREDGKPCRLVLLTDLKNPLREEERRAWKRLIRVIAHEVNNSIAPISSLAASVQGRIEALDAVPATEREDLSEALGVVTKRSSNMARFLDEYTKLAKLPKPTLAPLDISVLIQSVIRLGWPVSLDVQAGASCIVAGDEGQLQQCLINLIRNAVDAAEARAPEVSISWEVVADRATIFVKDNGPGISDTKNLFVPFYTTKKEGSGVGLAISQEIVENHGGLLDLANRSEGRGCQASLSLPLVK